MTFDASRDLRPLDYAGILDKSLELYVKNAPFVLAVAATVYVPVILLHVLGLVFFPITLDVSRLRPMVEVPPYWQYMPLIDVAAVFIANGALIVALAYILMGRQSTLLEVYRALKTRLPALVGTALLASLTVFIMFRMVWGLAYLLLIPFAFVTEAVVLEKRKYLDALQRSVFMTMLGGEGPRVLIISVAVGLVSFLANWILSYILSWLPTGDGMKMVSNTLYDLLNLALTPFSLFAMTLLYIDIRVRYDSYDVRALENELPE